MRKRNQNSTSNHRSTSEKYYDCFQCAEQCRHLSLRNNYKYSKSNKSSYISNKNSHTSNKNSYNSNKDSYDSKKNSYNSNKNFNNNNHNKNSNKNKIISNRAKMCNDSKKINDNLNGQKSYFQMKKNAKEKDTSLKEKVLKFSNRQVSNYQIAQHPFLKNEISNYLISNTQFLNNQISNQPIPARKRSSLARPVKIYDSFAPSKWMMNNGIDYPLDEFEDLEKFENRKPFEERDQFDNREQFDKQEEFADREQFEDREQLEYLNQNRHQHLEPNSSRANLNARDEDTDWPIRLRLEELLAIQNKKKKRKSIVTIRKSKIIKADTGKNSFNDTERLLKVLSNHVDQDSKYKVKRCCVM